MTTFEKMGLEMHELSMVPSLPCSQEGTSGEHSLHYTRSKPSLMTPEAVDTSDFTHQMRRNTYFEVDDVRDPRRSFSGHATDGGQETGSKIKLPPSNPISALNARTTIDRKRIVKIMTKINFHILPPVMLLYLCAFMDRTAMANVKVAGMNQDIKITHAHYTIAVVLFFFTYTLFEVPSNLVLRWLGAKIWLPVIGVGWGTAMLLTAFVNNTKHIFIVRLVLGACEAGVFPGIVYYLGGFFPRTFVSHSIGLFFSAGVIAGSVGGCISLAVQVVNPLREKMADWRMILVIEGICSILVSVGSYFFIRKDIDDCGFLSAEDKAYMKECVLYDQEHYRFKTTLGYHWKFVKNAFTDGFVWLLVLLLFCASVPMMSVALTLPIIIEDGLGYNKYKAQGYTAIVYFIAAIYVVATAIYSDRWNCRILVYVISMFIGVMAWLIGTLNPTSIIRYLSTIFMAMGSFGGACSVFALVSGNTSGDTKRNVAMALVIGCGVGPGGILGSVIFLEGSAPLYREAFLINAGFSLAGVFLGVLYGGAIHRAGNRKARLLFTGRVPRTAKEDYDMLGDKSPFFFYIT